MDEIEDAYMKSLMGPQKKNKQRREKDNKLCAYHEAGHAIAAYCCPDSDPVKLVTIIPAGSAGGVTVRVPEEDRMVQTRGEMIGNIIVSLGGRIAEELVLDDISTGASSDISHATKIARAMVERYGMSRLGTVLYNLMEAIRQGAVMLAPFIPTTAEEILNELNKQEVYEDVVNWMQPYVIKD